LYKEEQLSVTGETESSNSLKKNQVESGSNLTIRLCSVVERQPSEQDKLSSLVIYIDWVLWGNQGSRET